MYNNNNNNNQSQVQTDIWSQPQQVKIIRWTKSRPNKDGNGSNRGVQVQSLINNDTRWVSLWDGHHLFQSASWGSTVFYDPNAETHQRLQLTLANNTQSSADRYARAAEPQPDYNSHQYQQPDNYYNQQPQQSQPRVDEGLMSDIASVYSQMLAMAESICPEGYDAEQRKSVGISMSIEYFRQTR